MDRLYVVWRLDDDGNRLWVHKTGYSLKEGQDLLAKAIHWFEGYKHELAVYQEVK